MKPLQEPIGIVLAGGMGRRIGGTKATVELCGTPLICYPLRALQGALDDVTVIAKAGSVLPSLPGVTVWLEPRSPRHPLVGIVHALALAEGRAALICAVDLPFVTAAFVRRLVEADPGDAPVVLAAHNGAAQPLLGCYQPQAAELLAPSARQATMPLREAVEAIGPRLLEVEDPELLFNVNAPEDVLGAASIIDRRRRAAQA